MSINFQEEDGFPYEGPNSLKGMAEHLANAEAAYKLLRLYAEEIGISMVEYPGARHYRLTPILGSKKIMIHHNKVKIVIQISNSLARAQTAVDLIRDIRAGRLSVDERTEDADNPQNF